MTEDLVVWPYCQAIWIQAAFILLRSRSKGSIELSSDLLQNSPACSRGAVVQISRHHDGMARGTKSIWVLCFQIYVYPQKTSRGGAYFSLQQSARSRSVMGSFMEMSIKHTSRVTSHIMTLRTSTGHNYILPSNCGLPPVS